MSEVIGFNGPIYMTRPTKALVPILYEELRKLNLQNKGNTNYCSTQAVKNCIKKITAVDLHESIMVDNELEIKAYYAGHVLGAAMFWIKVGSQSVVYTGDFNMNPDRHLGAAWIDKCQPDLLITESHYATTIPTKKRCRDEDFLKYVHDCLTRGGKVLIPIFILGRAQELCLILDKYWQKMNLSYPIYFATESLTERTNSYYKMFVSWTNQQMHKSNPEGDAFEFKHIKSFHRRCTSKPEPMVVLATNGMLQSGLSMEIFKEWAHDEKNLLILPDVCAKGTLGHRIMSGAREIQFQNKEIIKVQLQVEQMSFDAVADVNGLLELVEMCDAKNILLAQKKTMLSKSVQDEIIAKFKIKCFIPTYGEKCLIKTPLTLPSDTISLPPRPKMISELCANRLPSPHTRESISRCYTIMVFKEQRILLQNLTDALSDVCDLVQKFSFTSKIIFEESDMEKNIVVKIFELLKKPLASWSIKLDEDNTITVESIKISVSTDENDSKQKIVSLTWKNNDDDIASYILYMLQNLS